MFKNVADIKCFYDKIWTQKFNSLFPYRIYNTTGENLGPMSLLIKNERANDYHVYMSYDVFEYKLSKIDEHDIPIKGEVFDMPEC